MALQAYSLARDGSTALSPHFCVREFRCKDGSDPVFIDTALAELLERIREHFGKPVTITSAYRTPAHNAKAGGAKFSQHLYGRAADIRVQDVSVEGDHDSLDDFVAHNELTTVRFDLHQRGREVFEHAVPEAGTAGKTVAIRIPGQLIIRHSTAIPRS